MTDEVMVMKITEHDRHLDSLTDTISKTNDKLDSLVTVMSKQNVLIEKMSSLGRSLDALRDVARATESVVNKYPDVEDIKESIKVTEGLPSTVTLRWAVGILLTYLAVSGNYIIGHIHMLESSTATHEKVEDIVTADFAARINKLEINHETNNHGGE